MIKKLLITVALAAAVIFGSLLHILATLKDAEPFDVWDEVDEFDYEQAVIDWENERYEEDLRDLED